MQRIVRVDDERDKQYKVVVKSRRVSTRTGTRNGSKGSSVVAQSKEQTELPYLLLYSVYSCQQLSTDSGVMKKLRPTRRCEPILFNGNS